MKVFLLAALTLAACQNDTRNLDAKIDKLDKKLDALMAQGGRGGNNAGAQRPTRAEPDRAKTYAVSVEGDSFDGPADAKITVIKAYDYACPFCERVRPTMAELHKKYGQDLRVVYKQLVVHPQTAMSGALAYCAAAKQGKGPEMDALIWEKSFKVRKYDSDQCWTGGTCEGLNAMAQELKLDSAKFKEDMKGCQQIVQNDMREMQKFGVASTPAFFINGRFLSGAMPLENFVTVIDEELKKANERIQQGSPKASYYQDWVIAKGLKSLEAPKQ
jgi:protein-disulfide isomerase